MNVVGKWELVSAKAMDFETMEDKWTPNEELKNLPVDNPFKKMMNMGFEFLEDGTLIMKAVVPNITAIPMDELKAAIESGQAVQEDGVIKLITKQEWKEEDGKLLIKTNVEGEILGEKIDPWQQAEEDGNTVIVETFYQIVRAGETPSVVRKTVPVEKVASEETANAAGTYKGIYTKFVGDPDTAKNDKEEFSLVLEPNGTGKSIRDGLEIKVPDWSVEDGKFKLTEEFIGTIYYTGTLDGKSLVLYNDDPEKPVTCMYVFEKE